MTTSPLDTKQIIIKSLEEYDKHTPAIDYLLDNAEKRSPDFIVNNSDMKRDKVIFYDDDRNEILRSEFESLGFYYNKYSLWLWGWANPGLLNNNTYLCKKILQYGLDLRLSRIDLKYQLITSRMFIRDRNQLDVHLAVSAYLIKKPYIYPHKIWINQENDEYIINYLILTDTDIIDKVNNLLPIKKFA
jgi:hypothetical protein